MIRILQLESSDLSTHVASVYANNDTCNGITLLVDRFEPFTFQIPCLILDNCRLHVADPKMLYIRLDLYLGILSYYRGLASGCQTNEAYACIRLCHRYLRSSLLEDFSIIRSVLHFIKEGLHFYRLHIQIHDFQDKLSEVYGYLHDGSYDVSSLDPSAVPPKNRHRQ